MSKPIEFKAGSLTAMTALIRELDNVRLADTMHAMLGGMGEFFAGEATVIDLSQATRLPERPDWTGTISLLRRYGLQPVAVRNVPEALAESARKAGLAVIDGNSKAEVPAALSTEPSGKNGKAEQALPAAPATEAQPAAGKPAMIVERPVRSGQQIYARGSDLVIMGGVSNGAEVIADGSIHCYGPLRGRAVAGAQGDTGARLYCTNFGPELVSIAGVYRTFERGIPENLAGKPATARLRALAGEGERNSLSIEPLSLD